MTLQLSFSSAFLNPPKCSTENIEVSVLFFKDNHYLEVPFIEKNIFLVSFRISCYIMFYFRTESRNVRHFNKMSLTKMLLFLFLRVCIFLHCLLNFW